MSCSCVASFHKKHSRADPNEFTEVAKRSPTPRPRQRVHRLPWRVRSGAGAELRRTPLFWDAMAMASYVCVWPQELYDVILID